MAGKTILEVQNLTKFFNTPGGQLHAVDGVSFKIEEGRTLGIVGESGCGKSTTGRTILKLLEPTGGKILFDGKDITNYSRKQMRPLRQEMQMSTRATKAARMTPITRQTTGWLCSLISW